jgi:hypothetical protein
MNSNQNRRLLIFTHPRTASNLFMRILSLASRPDVIGSKSAPFFLDTLLKYDDLKLEQCSVENWSEEERQIMKNCFQAAFDEMDSYACEATATGKIAFLNMHTYFAIDPATKFAFNFGGIPGKAWKEEWEVHWSGNETDGLASNGNETIFPDPYLKSWKPIFLIRHPALAFPSQYRAMLDLRVAVKPHEIDERILRSTMTWRWNRRLFDWYIQNLPTSTCKDEDGKWVSDSTISYGLLTRLINCLHSQLSWTEMT